MPVSEMEPVHITRSSRSSSGIALVDTQVDMKLQLKRIDPESTDDQIYSGYSFGSEKPVSGEAVFLTSMTGYVDALTDPSYAGQILVLTFPHVGNRGVPDIAKLDEYGIPVNAESSRIQVSGLVVFDYLSPEEFPMGCSEATTYSHWRAVRSLSQWLKDEGVPAMYAVDTRALTLELRNHGSVPARMGITSDVDLSSIQYIDNISKPVNYVAEVCRKEVQVYNRGGSPRICAIDFGLKNAQLRELVKRGAEVTVVPGVDQFDEIARACDGLFLSNGPGDPNDNPIAVESLTRLLNLNDADRIPIFGICLGHQIMSIACGAKTYKMTYGNRGSNQPAVHDRTGRCLITSQNHGYATDADSIPKDEWEPLFTNGNDKSNEGLAHKTKPFFSVQFHPEARCGPNDANFLFDVFLDATRHLVAQRAAAAASPSSYDIHGRIEKGLNKLSAKDGSVTTPTAPAPGSVKSAVILGSGGLRIGQAGEFDYSGAQAIKAFREEGVRTVLVNPNIATVQTTDQGMADKVYSVPVTAAYVEQVLEIERPDVLVLSFGGQTALNTGLTLKASGILDRLDIRVLGTTTETIHATEDRESFNQHLKLIGEKTMEGVEARNVTEAIEVANTVGYPVLVRASFALGGLGSGFANNEEELVALMATALIHSDTALVESSIAGWKELEYEVVRDIAGNILTVCNMENVDPVGVHTGESVVVAPSQTLNDREYHLLRTACVRIASHFQIVGECNIQFALDPADGSRYRVIELNPRLSRSSALASKATGYPLAYVAAKLTLGYTLPELENSVTRKGCADFEPALDYVVVKVPKWDLDKFPRVPRHIGTAMKSVGETMGIGRTFEEALQKALRMADPATDGFTLHSAHVHRIADLDDEALCEMMTTPNDHRMYALAAALHRGFTLARIYELTKIDHWFLQRMARIILCTKACVEYGVIEAVPRALFHRAKVLGICDAALAREFLIKTQAVSEKRRELGLRPVVRQIDTVAGEYPSSTGYLYLTYGAESDRHDMKPLADGAVIVLGSGVYRIGSSVEFDWCSVQCVDMLKKKGLKPIMVNYNPETVSTDYDQCSRLYFEELTEETIQEICHFEANSRGTVVSVGGQIPNNVALPLHNSGIKVLGTSPVDIDSAEDRNQFSTIVDTDPVLEQPKWGVCKAGATNEEVDALLADIDGLPVVVRPSYVLSGAAMRVVGSKDDLLQSLSAAARVSPLHPVVISKYIEQAREVDVDAVAINGELVHHIVCEHVEQAGVHSGDASLVHPATNLSKKVHADIREVTARLGKALNISGPYNIQLIVNELGESDTYRILIIECNVRASRSLPFVSKSAGINMIHLATAAMLGDVSEFKDQVAAMQAIPCDVATRYAVKVPQFSFSRLTGADPVLGVEMLSTGEVACFGETAALAFSKANEAVGTSLPQSTLLLSVGNLQANEMALLLPAAKTFVELGIDVVCTSGTAKYLNAGGLSVKGISHKEALKQVEERKFDTVCCVTSTLKDRKDMGFDSNGYRLRQMAISTTTSLYTNIHSVVMMVQSMRDRKERASGKDGHWKAERISDIDSIFKEAPRKEVTATVKGCNGCSSGCGKKTVER